MCLLQWSEQDVCTLNDRVLLDLKAAHASESTTLKGLLKCVLPLSVVARVDVLRVDAVKRDAGGEAASMACLAAERIYNKGSKSEEEDMASIVSVVKEYTDSLKDE